jgi:hypothetical protein
MTRPLLPTSNGVILEEISTLPCHVTSIPLSLSPRSHFPPPSHQPCAFVRPPRSTYTHTSLTYSPGSCYQPHATLLLLHTLQPAHRPRSPQHSPTTFQRVPPPPLHLLYSHKYTDNR